MKVLRNKDLCNNAGFETMIDQFAAGEPLVPGLESRFGALVGQGLRDVRIHQGRESDALCRSIDAAAFTAGSHIFFAEGRYDPDSSHGLRLLAHELAHVVQQRAGRVNGSGRWISIGPENDSHELEADAFASLVDGTPPSAAAIDSLHSLRAARPTASPVRALVLQRSALALAQASQAVPPAAVLPNNYGPTTCHEAAIGWLLGAEGYTHPWQLMRVLWHRLPMPYNYGWWVGTHIYKPSAVLHLAELLPGHIGHAAYTPDIGDILFTTAGGPSAQHSMVVVGHNPLRIRGFNNAGTFNYPAVAVPAPVGGYDNNDRDITIPALWNPAGTTFGAGGALSTLRWVRYANAAQQLRAALTHYTYSMLRTPGWRHTGGGGGCAAPGVCLG